MGQTLNRIIAFIVSALVATVLANIFSTQFVIAGLNANGGDIGMNGRLSMTAHDLLNFGPLYAVFITLGLAIAFLAGSIVYRFAKTGRTLVYVVAGIVCFIVMLWAMKNVFFGVPVVAGARSMLGVIFQTLAGAAAGYIFARMTAPKQT